MNCRRIGIVPLAHFCFLSLWPALRCRRLNCFPQSRCSTVGASSPRPALPGPSVASSIGLPIA